MELTLNDHEQSERDRDGISALRIGLRYTSLFLVLFATMAALLLSWRRHFGLDALWASGFTIATSLYAANYCFRRSRGWAVRLGPWLTSPEDDPDDQEMKDKSALFGIAIYIGTVVFAIFRTW